MEVTAYLGTVTAMVTLTLGAVWAIASLLGRRIDDLGQRMGRLESQNDAIIDAIGDLGQRVAHLDARGS